MHELFSMYTSPGILTELMHLFLAEGLEPGDSDPQEDEDLEVHVFSMEEFYALQERGELRDAKTLMALFWLRSR